jgi:hypothetical protein
MGPVGSNTTSIRKRKRDARPSTTVRAPPRVADLVDLSIPVRVTSGVVGPPSETPSMAKCQRMPPLRHIFTVLRFCQAVPVSAKVGQLTTPYGPSPSEFVVPVPADKSYVTTSLRHLATPSRAESRCQDVLTHDLTRSHEAWPADIRVPSPFLLGQFAERFAQGQGRCVRETLAELADLAARRRQGSISHGMASAV